VSGCICPPRKITRACVVHADRWNMYDDVPAMLCDLAAIGRQCALLAKVTESILADRIGGEAQIAAVIEQHLDRLVVTASDCRARIWELDDVPDALVGPEVSE
jgi:hypothetical protein